MRYSLCFSMNYSYKYILNPYQIDLSCFMRSMLVILIRIRFPLTFGSPLVNEAVLPIILKLAEAARDDSSAFIKILTQLIIKYFIIHYWFD